MTIASPESQTRVDDISAGVYRISNDPGQLRYVSFSHYEADECGSLNGWLALALHAEPLVLPSLSLTAASLVSGTRLCAR